MVLVVLLGLNRQNNEGRSLFDKGSTNREKMGAKRLIITVSEQGRSVASVTTCWQPDLHVLTDDRPAS